MPLLDSLGSACNASLILVRGVGVMRGYLIYCIIYQEKLATELPVIVKKMVY